MTRLCSACGRSISRGDTGNTPTRGRCLVCRVDADLAGWRYVAPNAEQRRANCRATYARRKARLWRSIKTEISEV